MNHIAIIHMGAVGDMVQTLPTLRAVRRHWPEARIALVGRPERTVLAHIAGLVDECLDYDTSHVPADTELVIDLLGAPLPGGLPHGATCLTFPSLPPADCPEPAAEWIFRQVAARLDLPAVPLAPEIPVPEAVVRSGRAALEAAGMGRRFVAIHPGSGSLRKNWPLERFAKIARRLAAVGRQPLWLSGPAERDRGTLAGAGLGGTRSVASGRSGPRQSVALQGPLLADLPLDVLAGVVALADAYVGNDSGITQVAAAIRRPDGRAVRGGSPHPPRGPYGDPPRFVLGEREPCGCTPIVALFGPSNVEGWAPRGRHVHIVKSKSGGMEAITVEAVWAALQALLA